MNKDMEEMVEEMVEKENIMKMERRLTF